MPYILDNKVILTSDGQVQECCCTNPDQCGCSGGTVFPTYTMTIDGMSGTGDFTYSCIPEITKYFDATQLNGTYVLTKEADCRYAFRFSVTTTDGDTALAVAELRIAGCLGWPAPWIPCTGSNASIGVLGDTTCTGITHSGSTWICYPMSNDTPCDAAGGPVFGDYTIQPVNLGGTCVIGIPLPFVKNLASTEPTIELSVLEYKKIFNDVAFLNKLPEDLKKSVKKLGKGCGCDYGKRVQTLLNEHPEIKFLIAEIL